MEADSFSINVVYTLFPTSHYDKSILCVTKYRIRLTEEALFYWRGT